MIKNSFSFVLGELYNFIVAMISNKCNKALSIYIGIK
jgi:hypothetical protein